MADTRKYREMIDTYNMRTERMKPRPGRRHPCGLAVTQAYGTAWRFVVTHEATGYHLGNSAHTYRPTVAWRLLLMFAALPVDWRSKTPVDPPGLRQLCREALATWRKENGFDG